MASKNQIELATFIKSVHDRLRKTTKEKGLDLAWNEHLEDLQNLEKYSNSMQELAYLWEQNSITNHTNESYKKCAQSRIKWIIEEIYIYFSDGINERRLKEFHLLKIWYNETVSNLKVNESVDCINILDVGSCYNPFKNISKFKVTAIDLYPNKELAVYKSDFLKVKMSPKNFISIDFDKHEISSLPIEHFECVIFSLYLEYIPTSLQRIQSCEKAYKLLKPEGILIIITPDSEHVGKNAKLMKNWRYALGKIGFLRIKFEKLHHLTCMIYRKSIDTKIANHWSELHKENHMTFSLDIPQDKKLDI